MVLPEKQEDPGLMTGVSHIKSGIVLLSHTLTRAVPSALEGLTAEFGMGSGVTPPLWSPEVQIPELGRACMLKIFHKLIDAPFSVECGCGQFRFNKHNG